MNREGDVIHNNTVRTYMREMGIMAIYPGPNLSKRNLQHRMYPYLLRGLQITEPNQVWGVDITYIRMNRSLKYNEVYLNDYKSPRETRHGVERYIYLHNHYLPHPISTMSYAGFCV